MIFGVICVELSRKFSKNPRFWQKVFLHRTKISKVFLQRCPHPLKISLISIIWLNNQLVIQNQEKPWFCTFHDVSTSCATDVRCSWKEANALEGPLIGKLRIENKKQGRKWHLRFSKYDFSKWFQYDFTYDFSKYYYWVQKQRY